MRDCCNLGLIWIQICHDLSLFGPAKNSKFFEFKSINVLATCRLAMGGLDLGHINSLMMIAPDGERRKIWNLLMIACNSVSEMMFAQFVTLLLYFQWMISSFWWIVPCHWNVRIHFAAHSGTCVALWIFLLVTTMYVENLKLLLENMSKCSENAKP